MKAIQAFFGACLCLGGIACQQQSSNPMPLVNTNTPYADYPTYEGSDLGVNYSPDKTIIKVWSPSASALKLRLYEQGAGENLLSEHEMQQDKQGVWSIELPKDQNGKYYTVQAKNNEQWGEEVADPYAKAVGVNGNRGMILDMASTNPEGWDNDQKPAQQSFSDIIIYELHVRDLSIHPQSGIEHKGKFLGLTETGTKGPNNTTTGLDHIKSLGVTHVHILPAFDHASIDESKLDKPQFNWGYDPKNYNVPEGSFSTNPNDGAVRVKEFKQMVKALHENGLRVVLDVVYNHTFSAEKHCFNQLVPGYYYRQNTAGELSNASACGNETASERAMMRKYMIESFKHWVTEYHLDGFRVDLMGIHDIETMNHISQAVHELDPSIFIYGEGWKAGDSPISEDELAVKKNTFKLDKIAAFSDDMRDGIKGSWHDTQTKGFATGVEDEAFKEAVKFGITGGIQNPQVDFTKVPYSKAAWAKEPYQNINYVACHDNHTLWDRILESNEADDEATRTKMHLLSNTIVFTSQGIPFLHAGGEFLRTKNGEENSYKSPDDINRLDWVRKASQEKTVAFYQKLIALRKNHPAFRLPNAAMILEHLRFEDTESPHLIAYTLFGSPNGDTWEEIRVFFNGGNETLTVEIPKDGWKVVLEGDEIDEEGIRKQRRKKLKIPAYSAVIIAR